MMEAEIVIRGYEARDLEACRQLWYVLTEWHRQIYDSPGIGGDNPGLIFDEHLAKVGSENIWVAEAENKLVGLTGLIIEGQSGELKPVVVLDEYRGLGVGRKLVNTVVEQAQERGLTELKVLPVGRNEQAIQFFHELGFNVIGHMELFQQLNKPKAQQKWQDRETIAGRNFKV
ncbi:GNAT family N-acetyltransferase [Candidatus Leptofilum sp.]|uniref:GNAT family N-acetyltransferase n=1 Tax=Candidatus Leptofilum sp. TaxID=3241576 RepID=UPI003B59D44A